jgi:16S rRNA G966 N2-methylase RsmD
MSRKTGRPPLGKRAMTPAERRAKLAKKVARQKDAALKRQAIRADYEARACKGGTVQDLVALAESGEKFSCIYADPPWDVRSLQRQGQGTERRSVLRHVVN